MLFATSWFRQCAAIAALAVAPLAASVAAPTFSFSRSSGTLHPAGSHFSVDVVGSGLSDLYAYQFSINFNPALLRVLGVTEGPFLATGGSTFFDGGAVDNSAGKVGFTFDTLIAAVPGVSGGGVLAHLDLAALASGASTLSLSDVLALDSALNDIVVTALPIGLAVPEPETLVLLSLGAGAWLISRRRRGGSGARGGPPGVVATA